MITKHFKKFLIAPIVILALGVIFGIVNGGLNLGIDFTGGSIVTIDFQEEFDTAVVQQALDQNGMGDSPIVKSGEGYTQAEIRMRTLDTDELQSTTNNAILEDIKETYPEAEITTVDKVGGVASADLVKNAFLAVAIACGLMLIYIWIRFQLYNGISAVVMLVHDVGIMIAIMCILQIQINSAFIAACLTIIGYSINNTIVIFDRVRDNLKIMNPKRIPRAEIADTSIKGNAYAYDQYICDNFDHDRVPVYFWHIDDQGIFFPDHRWFACRRLFFRISGGPYVVAYGRPLRQEEKWCC